MKLHLLLLPMLFVALAGHASSRQQKDDLTVVANSGATSAYTRMHDQKYLTLANIEELTAHKVSPKITLRYLQKFQVVYNMTSEKIDRLKKAGVNDDVIDFLVATRHMYGQDDRYMDPNYDPFHGFDEEYFRIHHYYPPNPDGTQGTRPW